MHSDVRWAEPPNTRAPSDEDSALLAAVASGDRDALGRLYDRHSGVVFGLARRMLGATAAEDLVQDVFLEAWHHAAEYSPERGSVRAWLIVRARSRALDRLGKRARDARLAEEAGTLPGREGPETMGLAEVVDARRARSLASRLAPQMADVLDLAYFEGLSCSEIAARLAVPIGTVKSRLARSLDQLRAAIGPADRGVTHD
jgi:RNA polymerase sigma-70 factor (ECF subfamily)